MKINNATQYNEKDIRRLVKKVHAETKARQALEGVWGVPPLPHKLAIRHFTPRPYRPTSAERPQTKSPEGRGWGQYLRPGEMQYVDSVYWRRNAAAGRDSIRWRSRLTVSLVRPHQMFGTEPAEVLAASATSKLPEHIVRQLVMALSLVFSEQHLDDAPLVYEKALPGTTIRIKGRG